jgi:GNAT superfamily N-acetyltransferase
MIFQRWAISCRLATVPRASAALQIRRLARDDMDAVVALDAPLAGRTRRAYFERRLGAALRQAERHLQFAAVCGEDFLGHALGRVLEGEFGHVQRALRLVVISVAPKAQRRGIGRALHLALEDQARKGSIAELRSVAAWRDHDLLRFLDGMGYELAPAQVLERAAANPIAADAALEVRSLSARDLEDVVRVDRAVAGRERRDFVQRALDEALRESGVRISLAARVGGEFAGFVMARADLGDYNRTEPVAVLDTIGVAPEHARHGVGRTLLAQLLRNLMAVGIERLETVVEARSSDLGGFFARAGFVPAQRLAFVKTL